MIEKYREIQQCGSIGYSTNLEKTFDMILQRCIINKVKSEDMPNKIFLLTDGQFDQQTKGSGSTVFQNAKKSFSNHGYQLPTIIFWNLRTTADPRMPVTAHETGCVMISGWSQNILKSILAALDVTDIKVPNPYECMLEVLNGERYNVLQLAKSSCECVDCNQTSSCSKDETENVCKDGRCSLDHILENTEEEVKNKDKLNNMVELFKRFIPLAMPLFKDFTNQMKTQEE